VERHGFDADGYPEPSIKMNHIWIDIKRMPTHNTTSDVTSVPDPDPAPDPVIFVSNFKYAHKKVFF
jgi:hypothetical protein